MRRFAVLALALIAAMPLRAAEPAPLPHDAAVLPGVFLPVDSVRAMIRTNETLKKENEDLRKQLAKPKYCL